MMKRVRRGFTIAELLVVIAITTIILALIAVPLVQGFRLMRAAQSFSEAQARAKIVIEKISREMGSAAAVLDNSSPAAAVEVRVPLVLAQTPAEDAQDTIVGGLEPPTPQYGSVLILMGKVDIILASKGDPGNPTYNPGRDMVDPTLVNRSPIGQINIPVAPGSTLVRYWVGLRNPIDSTGNAAHYANPWYPVLAGAARGDENLFVLHRAEVQPYIYNSNSGRWEPNTTYFAVDANNRIIINDPGFFVYDPRTFIDNLPAHQARVRAWEAASTIVVQDYRTDMLAPVVDEAEKETVYDFAGVIGGSRHYAPRVRPLVRFQPVRVTNEPAAGNPLSRVGVEAIDPSTRLAADTFQTDMIGWTIDSLVRFYDLDPSTDPAHWVARWRQPTGGSFTENYRKEIAYLQPGQDDRVGGVAYFQMSDYMEAAKLGPTLIGNYVSGGGGNRLILFTMDERRGRINMAFPLGNALGLIPSVPTSVPNANFDGWWNSGSANQQTRLLARRFIDLRTLTGGGNAFNPLANSALGYNNPNGKIVPGSEVIVGPDQRPGPNFGFPVRYTRVSASQRPSLNQYKINYTDIAEPTDYQAALGVPDPGVDNDVRDYIQPRFKKGYVEFYSDQSVPFAAGNIQINFDFQLNEATDYMAVDYNSNQQFHIEMTLRRFPSTDDRHSQSAIIKDTVTVRNLLR
ncbi:MAG: prepilin-type N-terminal cleavage/methylation domain-containing protein [Fimbriimonadales bacterium]